MRKENRKRKEKELCRELTDRALRRRRCWGRLQKKISVRQGPHKDKILNIKRNSTHRGVIWPCLASPTLWLRSFESISWNLLLLVWEFQFYCKWFYFLIINVDNFKITVTTNDKTISIAGKHWHISGAWCKYKTSGKSTKLRVATCLHTHSQRWPCPQKFLAYLVILCFWEAVSQTKYCCSLKVKKFGSGYHTAHLGGVRMKSCTLASLLLRKLFNYHFKQVFF